MEGVNSKTYPYIRGVKDINEGLLSKTKGGLYHTRNKKSNEYPDGEESS